MELKKYDKSWLPAFKGAFLIIFGIIALLKIVGTITTVAFLFGFLIAMMGILLIATGVRFKKSGFRLWTIASGIIHLAFFAYILSFVDSGMDIYEARKKIVLVIMAWMFFYAATEIVEAVLLYTLKNAFWSLFVINGILTLLFAWLMHQVYANFTEQTVVFIGLFALVFGIVNLLSSHLLSRIKE
jgi:uncharacterized membrane protein HdeD (DUF308 family)